MSINLFGKGKHPTTRDTTNRPRKPKWDPSLLGSGVNRRNTQTYNEDYALWQWNTENKYNSPAQQMARFSDAGLNRHLIYGQGTPGNASPMKQTEPYQNIPDVNSLAGATNGPLALLSRFADVKNKMAQTGWIQANTDLKNQEIGGKFFGPQYTGKNIPTMRNLEAWDPKDMNMEQYKTWKTNIKAYYEAEAAVWNAKTAKEKALAQEKMNKLLQKNINWYAVQQVTNMAKLPMGLLGR